MNKIKNIRHTIVVYLTTAVVAIIAMVFLYTVVLINAYIPSESMENTLMTGDRVIGKTVSPTNLEMTQKDLMSLSLTHQTTSLGSILNESLECLVKR